MGENVVLYLLTTKTDHNRTSNAQIRIYREMYESRADRGFPVQIEASQGGRKILELFINAV